MKFIDPDEPSKGSAFIDPDEKPKSAPKKSSMSPLRGALTEAALSASKGMMGGGAMLGLFGESQKQANQLLENAAYKAGGGVTDVLAGKVPPEVAGGLGYATNVGIQSIPTVLGSLLSSEAAAPTLNRWSHSLMQRALKPTKADVSSGRAERAIQTMLDEGVSASRGGMAKMRDTVTNLNDEVAGLIKGSTATVDRDKVAEKVLDVMEKYRKHPTPNFATKPIEAVWDDFMTHSAKIPIQKAQEMKQLGGADLGPGAWGKGLAPDAQRDALKAIVRGLKDEIETAVPAVGPLNKRESDILNALRIVSNRLSVSENVNPIGLGILNPRTLPIWLWDRSPWALSLTARGLNQGQRILPGAFGATVGGLYGNTLGYPDEFSGRME